MSSVTFLLQTNLFDEVADDPDDRDELTERYRRLMRRAFAHAGLDVDVAIDPDGGDDRWAADDEDDLRGIDRDAAEGVADDVLELFLDCDGKVRDAEELLFANDLIGEVEGP